MSGTAFFITVVVFFLVWVALGYLIEKNIKKKK